MIFRSLRLSFRRRYISQRFHRKHFFTYLELVERVPVRNGSVEVDKLSLCVVCLGCLASSFPELETTAKVLGEENREQYNDGAAE